MDERTKRLLKEADELLKDPAADLKAKAERVKEELKEATARRDQAYKRMKEQEAAGEKRLAALSRKAYRYGRDYVKKLTRIVKGLETQAKVAEKTSGGLIMTKQSKKRYVDEEYIDGLTNFYDQK